MVLNRNRSNLKHSHSPLENDFYFITEIKTTKANKYKSKNEKKKKPKRKRIEMIRNCIVKLKKYIGWIIV